MQFAYVKVTDPNTGLPKNVLIAWCGEGVPERTKGYFTSHLATVSKFLHVRNSTLPTCPRIDKFTNAKRCFRGTMSRLQLGQMVTFPPQASFKEWQTPRVPNTQPNPRHLWSRPRPLRPALDPRSPASQSSPPPDLVGLPQPQPLAPSRLLPPPKWMMMAGVPMPHP